MPHAIQDLEVSFVGQKFGRLTIIGTIPQEHGQTSRKIRIRRKVLCRCECGKEKILSLDNLRFGGTKSCGCLSRELASKRAKDRHERYRAQFKSAPGFKQCRGQCHQVKPVTEFSTSPKKPDGLYGICISCAREKRWLREYGITAEQYAEMAADGCQICGRNPSANLRLSVDHNHETGAVSGILCHRCNTAIGMLQEDPALVLIAAGYVQRKHASIDDPDRLAATLRRRLTPSALDRLRELLA